MNVSFKISDTNYKNFNGGVLHDMEKLNEESAPNNNLTSITIQSSKQILGNKAPHEFSEELSDGGERDKMIQKQQKWKNKPLKEIKW